MKMKSLMQSNALEKVIVVIILLSIHLFSCEPKPKKLESDGPLTQVETQSNEYDSTLLEDLYNKLVSGKEPDAKEIGSFARKLETRFALYSLLSEFRTEHLFPAEYYSFEKASESVMANWLAYPTELDTIPSSIKLLKKIDHKKGTEVFTYYVYQFKTEEPHWAAKDGWMLGVVGPYTNGAKPYDWVTGTFSRFTKMYETTPEKEVEWIHENIALRQ